MSSSLGIWNISLLSDLVMAGTSDKTFKSVGSIYGWVGGHGGRVQTPLLFVRNQWHIPFVDFIVSEELARFTFVGL